MGFILGSITFENGSWGPSEFESATNKMELNPNDFRTHIENCNLESLKDWWQEFEENVNIRDLNSEWKIFDELKLPIIKFDDLFAMIKNKEIYHKVPENYIYLANSYCVLADAFKKKNSNNRGTRVAKKTTRI